MRKSAATYHKADGDFENLRYEIDLKVVKRMHAILVTVPFTACWFLYYMLLSIWSGRTKDEKVDCY